METSSELTILDQMSALSEGLRGRILLLLERHELTVSELCSITQLPQSTVSRHLKVLSDADWVTSRPDGTRRLYQMAEHGPGSALNQLWMVARDQLERTPAADQDSRRLHTVLTQRRSRSEQFFAGAADRWDEVRDELFGSSFFLTALLGLLDEDLEAADLGCGSGTVALALAPFVSRVVAVDGSKTMLAAARKRLEGQSNVELRAGELESVPIEDASIDLATLILVLHHLADPGKAVEEVARILRPGGRVLIVDMLPHERVEYQHTMGHVWMGFAEARIRRLLVAAGLEPGKFRSMIPLAQARGPALFVVTATRRPE